MSFFLTGWKQPAVLLFLLGTTLLLVMLAVHAQESSTKPPKKDPRHEIFMRHVEKGDGRYDFSNGPYLCKKYADTDIGGDNDREFCGCKILPKPDKAFHYPKANLNCPNEFFKVAMMAMCGNVWFDQIKFCSIATFFGDKAPPSVTDDNKDYNRALLLIDGCATCDSDAVITELRVTHYEADGDSFWSNCVEEPETQDFHAEGLNIAVPAGGNVTLDTAAFTVPVVVSHRICKNLFSTKGPENEYKDLKLHIKHTCGNKEGSVKVVTLPNLDLGDTENVENNVVELRGLWVDLNPNKDEKKQYRRVDPKDAKDAKDKDTIKYMNHTDVLWEKPHLGCWHAGGTCTL